MMKKIIFPFAVFLLFAAYACNKEKTQEYYYQCQNQSWPRFNKITFNIPINKEGGVYDIYFYADLTNEYAFETLDFNMIMSTPSGEERIMEYNMKPTGQGRSDILLKKDIFISKKGTLTLELESLMPLLNLTGISGMGIRMVQVGE